MILFKAYPKVGFGVRRGFKSILACGTSTIKEQALTK